MPKTRTQKTKKTGREEDEAVTMGDLARETDDQPLEMDEDEPMQEVDQPAQKEDPPGNNKNQPIKIPDNNSDNHPLEHPPPEVPEEQADEDPSRYEYPTIPYPNTYKNARAYLKAKWERPMLWSAFAEIDHGNHRYERLSYHTLYKAFVLLGMPDCETFEVFKEGHIGCFLQKDKVTFNPDRFGWGRYEYELYAKREHEDRDNDERTIVRDLKAGVRVAEKRRRRTIPYYAWRNTKGHSFVDKLVAEGKHYMYEPLLMEDEWKISEAFTKTERNEFARKWHVNFKRETDRRCCMRWINRHIRNHATKKQKHWRKYTWKWLDRAEFDEGQRALHGMYVDGERQRLILEHRNRQIERRHHKAWKASLGKEESRNSHRSLPCHYIQPEKTAMTAEDYARVFAIHSAARREHELHKHDPGYRTPHFANIAEIFLGHKPATFYPESVGPGDQDTRVETHWEARKRKDHEELLEAARFPIPRLAIEFHPYVEEYWDRVLAYEELKARRNFADAETVRIKDAAHEEERRRAMWLVEYEQPRVPGRPLDYRHLAVERFRCSRAEHCKPIEGG
ncbi:MAG: hypothetical protein Q9183_004276 [Haloplaca sp. 2 TL-2023]